ncbi:CRAL-TRIO lipid binding domain containing protein [Trema orientale]|uniref:CRAL-TRIO lipid binding domain containing protein n=1 Tax=Trema orientale TaxID=63057 RepID=A0A2P5BRN8_TREOI|nr:CRAL-TRIO lipid binding domain containing protein [Trema orientale]
MGDFESSKSTEKGSTIPEKKLTKSCSVVSLHKASSRPSFRRIASLGNASGSGAVGHVAVFVLKVAALETVRRFSKTKCPFVWRGLQALQVLCYPPFKWIQRLAPFKGLVKGVQMFSRPLLVLSIATAFSEDAESDDGPSSGTHESNASSDVPSEISSVQTTLETSVRDERPQSLPSEIWLIQFHKELESQGISLPQRINEDELRRFYMAANSNFSCFLSSIKKTIRWRETYRILSAEELEMWSNLVFWHGFDVKERPCLIVRLGLASISLPPPDRPRFAQAVVSQVEHGVLHLVNAENPEITVLVDCEGLSPFKIPMQVIRTCSTLLQDHFPNRLGCLFVVRLPPVLRVIAQTFIQMLKPLTRKKLKIGGETYGKLLSEYLRTIPSYLGGKCTCEKCSEIGISNVRVSPCRNEIARTESSESFSRGENPLNPSYETGVELNGNCDHVVRTAMISILMFWVFIALIAGIYDPESRPFFSST